MNQNVPIHQLLYSTLRIEGQLPNSTSVGTGFIVLYEKEDMKYLFIVTNKHVVNGASSGKFFFTKSDNGNNPLVGQRFDINITDFDKSWFFHPAKIDIAICPLVPLLQQIEKANQKVYFRSIPLSLIPTKEQEDKLTALEEIIFIGYPNAIYDTINLLPIIRKGTTATPIFIDYEGKPLFLIDASVFGGSSGSPVFIYNYGSYSTSEGNITVGTRIYFVGVVSKVFFNENNGKIEFLEVPTTQIPLVKTKQFLNLGMVIKSRVVVETIEEFLRIKEGR
ncbi:MAG: S1 family peptidase [Candidatus Heimdallarchaeaceae archaeon]